MGYLRVIEVVPSSLSNAPASCSVVSAVQRSKVIRYSNKIIIYWILGILQRCDVRSYIESLDWEVNECVILLGACNLSVHSAKHT